MLQVEHLYKSFGNYASSFQLKDISFKLPAGYVLGLIGENGSGKSTLIRTIMNIYHKDQGNVLVDGMMLDEDEAGMKSRVAVVLDQAMYEETMSCLDNAKICSMINPHFQMSIFMEECELWKLNPKKRLKNMSKGTQMKFQIAMAIATNPKLLIMDEPSANLDEQSRTIFKKRILDFVNDGTRSVLISSHLTRDLEGGADYILYLHQGKVYMNADKESLLDSYQVISGDRSEIMKMKSETTELVIGVDEQEYSASALIKKNSRYVPDISMKVKRPTLEDLMYYTSKREGRYRRHSLADRVSVDTVGDIGGEKHDV